MVDKKNEPALIYRAGSLSDGLFALFLAFVGIQFSGRRSRPSHMPPVVWVWPDH